MQVFACAVCCVAAHSFDLFYNKIMQTEKITMVEAEAEMKAKAGIDWNKEWQDLKEKMMEDDELVRYSSVDVFLGFCSGDGGIALLRDGEVVTKICLAIVG